MQLALSHLGYRKDSPKIVTLCPGADHADLPERIPFYLRQNCFRMPRERVEPEGFSKRFPCPFDLLEGQLIAEPSSFFYQGELVKVESRWGTFWQADFSDFTIPGSYQIETDYQISAPFMIADWIYDRLTRGFLTFLNGQRCGCEIPGVHPACHLDDGKLDTDGSYWPATGGWHDAGDFRKWLALTQGNLEALVLVVQKGHPGFRDAAEPETTGAKTDFVELNADKKKTLNFSPVKPGDWKAAQDIELELSSWQNYEVSFELRLPPEYELKATGDGNSRRVSLLEIGWGIHPTEENPNQQAVAYLQLQRSPSKPHRFGISGPYIRWYGKNEGLETIEFRESANMPTTEGDWQTFHLKQEGKRVEISINGTLVYAATDERMMPGGVTIRSWLSEDLIPAALTLRGVSVNKK